MVIHRYLLLFGCFRQWFGPARREQYVVATHRPGDPCRQTYRLQRGLPYAALQRHADTAVGRNLAPYHYDRAASRRLCAHPATAAPQDSARGQLECAAAGSAHAPAGALANVHALQLRLDAALDLDAHACALVY